MNLIKETMYTNKLARRFALYKINKTYRNLKLVLYKRAVE